MKQPKQKTCKVCKMKFTPIHPLQSICTENDFQCAKIKSLQDRQKKDAKEATRKRVETRKAKSDAKTKAQWMKEAQQAFNAYIRGRDEKEPCISCQRHHNGQYHAGHFRTTAAAPELRFNELNVWKQCAPCNNHKHGNITEYRINLVKRIGVEKVEWLESKHEPQKYTISDLQAIKSQYKAKLKELNEKA